MPKYQRVSWSYLISALVSGLILAGFVSFAGADNSAADKCAEIRNLYLLDTAILNAHVVPAAEGLPEYCRVTGYVLPAINFEIRLPTSQWNSKFYFAGCGGFCGRVMDRPGFTNAMNYGLERHYTVATTDMGHWGPSMMDGKWAYHARQQEIDFGYRATHEVCRVAKAVIQAYYGQPPRFSYFAGCSNGGRQALMEAIRYPEDFNGIICGAPALDFTGLIGINGTYLMQANRGEGEKPVIDWEDLDLIGQAVYAACDAIDGLKDGIIVDPRRCNFDPQSLICKGAAGGACLTPEQVITLKKFYGGAKDSKGNQLYPGGLPIGSESFWGLWIIGGRPGPYGGIMPALMSMFSTDGIKYLVHETDCASCSPYQFDFDSDPASLSFMADILNATATDLSKFKKAGGRMIMYQGWADPAVTPLRTTVYYEDVVKAMGGLEQTIDFFRLYMVPGMAHCQIPRGVGPDYFDLLKPLEDWVEKGQAPNEIIASQQDKEGKITRTRPLCVYPEVAMYNGTGNPDQAASFSCGTPQ